MNVLCIVERNHRISEVALDHFRNFKDIYLIVEHNIKNEAGIVIQGKGNYCSKFKKGKLKTKTGEQEHSIQLAERTEAVQV